MLLNSKRGLIDREEERKRQRTSVGGGKEKDIIKSECSSVNSYMHAENQSLQFQFHI